MADKDLLEREVKIFRDAAPEGAPLCLGFIGDMCLQREGSHIPILDAIDLYKPEVVQLFVPTDVLVSEIRSSFPSSIILASACTVSDARRLIEKGDVDGIIASGREAGGHGVSSKAGSGTLPLARRVVQIAKDNLTTKGSRIMVLAAGGIVDGAGVAACLALHCDGAVLGTRLWATHQSLGSKSAKGLLPHADADDVIRTGVYDAIGNKLASHFGSPQWRPPFNHSGLLRNPTIDKYHSHSADLMRFVEDLSPEDCRSELKNFVLAGEGVGSINELRDAEEIVREIEAETIASIQSSYALLR